LKTLGFHKNKERSS